MLIGIWEVNLESLCYKTCSRSQALSVHILRVNTSLQYSMEKIQNPDDLYDRLDNTGIAELSRIFELRMGHLLNNLDNFINKFRCVIRKF